MKGGTMERFAALANVRCSQRTGYQACSAIRVRRGFRFLATVARRFSKAREIPRAL